MNNLIHNKEYATVKEELKSEMLLQLTQQEESRKEVSLYLG
ncbi:hypothetical protein GCM10007383_34930 [Arenibacter certesii]|uniref:Uncharacterized protein n=1 Tax=Arenibacter certesii TaxID=228955 RepID=A0A918J5D2_9FLAO|nr:hypothetical protein GCM10007383_34930 [Arenibacter certesii]